MQITKNAVVSFHYTLNDPEGNILDSSDGREAFAYIHGMGMIVPGLEQQLEGKTAGTKLKAEVAPAQGYGEVDPELMQKVPLDRFGGQNVEAGMQFQTPDNMMWSVVDIVDGHAMLNGNHPLAGVTLHFNVEITDVRMATADELSHGHVHGAGGHHH